MKKSRYKEEQIIAVLKEVDAGAKLQDVIRRLGISEQTYYRLGLLGTGARTRARKPRWALATGCRRHGRSLFRIRVRLDHRRRACAHHRVAGCCPGQVRDRRIDQ